MFQACLKGNLNAVVQLLKNPSVDVAVDGSQSLMWACYNGKFDIVDVLLGDSRVVVMAGSFDYSALYYTCGQGHLAILERLLKDPRVDPSVADNSALINACMLNYIDIVNVLLRDSRVNVTSVDERGCSALDYACAAGNLEIVTRLLQDPRTDPLAHDTIQCVVKRISFGVWNSHNPNADVVADLILNDHRVMFSSCVHDAVIYTRKQWYVSRALACRHLHTELVATVVAKSTVQQMCLETCENIHR